MRMNSTLKAALCGAVFYGATGASSLVAQTADSAVIMLDQGKNWIQTDRADFYSQDQGSQLMPLSWLEALKQPNRQPFLADNLSRYGYLPNPANTNGLPIGFTASGPEGVAFAGMTCSACHTRQITADGKAYRIDGGPAIVDWQSFSADLDAAAERILHNDADFETFAAAVLGPGTPQADDVKALRESLQLWYDRYHAWTSALPDPPWGPARMDAVGMIFNRLTGLDLGQPPSYLLKENIAKADAPVRYPFLWNASIQNWTQWAGFAPNGSDILALNRNLGQVYGVYGVFQPKKDWFHIPNVFGIDFLNNNSANFNGLTKLENLVKKIGPPKWPKEWAIDETLRAKGEDIYKNWRAPVDETTGQPGKSCNDCHGISKNLSGTWDTPVQNVGTDSKQMTLLKRKVQTGELKGAFVPLGNRLQETDAAIRVLTASVLDTIIEKYFPISVQASPADITFKFQMPPQLQPLSGVAAAVDDFVRKAPGGQDTGARYETRVLEGIWAAAPYLHNGSVPSLAELLKPANERVASFKVGPAYDKENVGLAVDQPKFDYTLQTTGCDALNSGNSRCGHEYGTQLKPDEKKALLEYLKTL